MIFYPCVYYISPVGMCNAIARKIGLNKCFQRMSERFEAKTRDAAEKERESARVSENGRARRVP